MALEVRFIDENGEERRSSPARDVAFFWPQLLQLAADGLRQEKLEPWLRGYLAAHQVTAKDLAEALQAYYRFCELALSADLDDPRKALHEAGFFRCHPCAQLAVCAKLGQIVSGAFWAGIRSSSPAGHIPPSVQALQEYSRDVLRIMSQPPRTWLQWLMHCLTGGGQ